MITTWKGKRSDLLLAFCYYILYVLGLHVLITLVGRRRHFHQLEVSESRMELLFDPGRLLFTFVVVSLLMSPMWVFFRKLPKQVTLDSENQTFTIEKKRRSKSRQLPLETLSYHYHRSIGFSVIEFYTAFQSSRGQLLYKKAGSIVAPAFGLSWNGRVLDAMRRELKALDIPENTGAKRKTIWQYLYD